MPMDIPAEEERLILESRKRQAAQVQAQTEKQKQQLIQGQQDQKQAVETITPPQKPRVMEIMENIFGGLSRSAVLANPFVPAEEKEKVAKEYYERSSELFYRQIGYPQYAGKYGAPPVPSGYEIQEVTETPEGLTFSFKLKTPPKTVKETSTVQPEPIQPTPSGTFYMQQRRGEYKTFASEYVAPMVKDVKMPEVGLAETLAQIQVKPLIDVPRLLGVPRTPQEALVPPSMRKETVRPFVGIAASLIAPTERLTYSVGTLVGLKTPRPPPYFSEEYGPEWGAGTIAGELLLSMEVGKVVGKVWEITPKIIKSPITGAVSKVTKPISGRIETWLMETQYRQASGWFIKEGIPSEAAMKGGWTWKAKVVMSLTGVKPYLPYGEVSIPVVETAAYKAIPTGLPYTEMGWALTEAPRMGGVFITKVATETSPKALELFFGVGKELISLGEALGEGQELSFKKPTEIKEPLEKGLPSSLLEKSYYPPVGGFEKGIKEVSTKGVMAWRKWPTIRELMSEQKLLPFVTQTQITRMGITPYIPDITVGATSKGMAQLLGVGVSLLPKALQQDVAKPKVETVSKLEPTMPELKQPTFEEPYLIQKMKLFPQVYPMQKEKQKLTFLPKLDLKPEIYEETFELQKQRLFPRLFQEQRQKQVQTLIPKLDLKPLSQAPLTLEAPQISRQKEKLVPITTFKLDVPQITKQAQMFKMPTPTILAPPKTIPPMFRLPRGGEDFSRLAKGLFGKWFKRTHAIPTEKQIMRELGFGVGKRRAKKRGATRRRR
jgi:hypothetical protein